MERKAILRGHKGSIQDLKLAPDASKVVSADILGTVCVFDGKFLSAQKVFERLSAQKYSSASIFLFLKVCINKFKVRYDIV